MAKSNPSKGLSIRTLAARIPPVSDPSTSWFHCGHCGSLFRATLGRDVRRACQNCGHDPSLGVKPLAIRGSEEEVAGPARPDVSSTGATRERHKKRRRKKSAPLLVLIVGWSFVMAGIIVFSNHYWKKPDRRDKASIQDAPEQSLSHDEIRMLNQHVEVVEAVVKHVVASTTPETISPYVLDAPSTFTDIARYYPMNPGVQILEPALQREDISIIRLPEGPAIEARWIHEDGRHVEAVFRMENDELRLDWHHFVRFSDVPWQLFLSGGGPDLAQFRLLARRRLTRMVLDDASARPLSIEFFAPRFGDPGHLGPASPPFDLDRDGELARKLTAAFDQSRGGIRPFGSLLPPMEADDEVIRVRVTVRRTGARGDHQFELVELHACHWLQHDDPGLPLLPVDAD